MNEPRAAAIVFTRMKNIGFPQSLMIQPEDFTQQDEKQYIDYIHSAMRNDIELRAAHALSRIVIADEKHVTLGAVCFLRDIVKDAWSTADEGRREIHGFVGCVWRREDFTADIGFPSRESLLALLEKWLLPHWEEPNYSKWAQFPHLSPYDHAVQGVRPALPAGEETPGLSPSSKAHTQWIFSYDKEEAAVAWALAQAAQGACLSLCTNLYVYSDQDRQNSFQYAVAMNRTAARPAPSVQPPAPKEKPAREAGAAQEAPVHTQPVIINSSEKKRKAGLAAGLGGAALLLVTAVLAVVGALRKNPEAQLEQAEAKAGFPWALVIVLAVIALGLLCAAFLPRRKQRNGSVIMPLPPANPLQPKTETKTTLPAPEKKKETSSDVFKL